MGKKNIKKCWSPTVAKLQSEFSVPVLTWASIRLQCTPKRMCTAASAPRRMNPIRSARSWALGAYLNIDLIIDLAKSAV